MRTFSLYLDVKTRYLSNLSDIWQSYYYYNNTYLFWKISSSGKGQRRLLWDFFEASPVINTIQPCPLATSFDTWVKSHDTVTGVGPSKSPANASDSRHRIRKRWHACIMCMYVYIFIYVFLNILKMYKNIGTRSSCVIRRRVGSRGSFLPQLESDTRSDEPYNVFVSLRYRRSRAGPSSSRSPPPKTRLGRPVCRHSDCSAIRTCARASVVVRRCTVHDVFWTTLPQWTCPRAVQFSPDDPLDDHKCGLSYSVCRIVWNKIVVRVIRPGNSDYYY